MFVSSEVGIAQSPYLSLHCPTSFDTGVCVGGGVHFCNMPMGSMEVNIYHRFGMNHTMLSNIQNSSIHAFYVQVFARRTQFTLSGGCESQSAHDKKSILCV